MISWLRNFFLENWEIKSISLVLATILWIIVNSSQTSQKSFDNIAVRVINIPPKSTIEGLLPDSTLSKRLSLTLVGKKNILEELTSSDFELVVDATGKSGEWQAPLCVKNLVSLNPNLDVLRGISRLIPGKLHLNFTQMIREKIPIVVTLPVGETPRDYQFLDIWPYHLYITVSGPEEVVKQLKARGLNLTFNLNQISRADLEILQSSSSTSKEEVSFPVPEEWKKIAIPALSDKPFDIDDPMAKNMKIDFVRSELHPIGRAIPISFFYPLETLNSSHLNPHSALAYSPLLENRQGIPFLNKNLFAKGVSKLFVELVHNMLQITVVVDPEEEKQYLDWSLQFINPRLLEDRYISILLSDISENERDIMNPKNQEEYLRNRFRKYMNQFELYSAQNVKFQLKVKLDDEQICFQEEL